MISRQCFTKEWIDDQRNILGKPIDPGLLEKAIMAFELVGELVESGLSFVFKGGTSLSLLMESIRRLSIDVDIVTEESAEHIEQILSDIVNRSTIFTSWKEDIREPVARIPKKHYEVYFDSSIDKRAPVYVLLDVVFGKSSYPKIQSHVIKSPFITVEKEVHIMVPTLNGILGDKLTAFAPHTIGIPFGKDKQTEINKQLFDIGTLFDIVDNLAEVKTSFSQTAIQQVGYHSKFLTLTDIQADIIGTCQMITGMSTDTTKYNPDEKEIFTGIRGLRSFLLISPYNIQEAQINAARCACLIAGLEGKLDLNIVRPYKPEKITPRPLSERFRRFERLKRTIPEAYYYWQVVDQLI
ncbi:MAG: nucleotidyl transferase AbiEii/AbiGii toxin family protein [archaeon]